MQPTEEEKSTQEDPYSRGFEFQMALSGQPVRRWAELWSPPDPQPDDDNADSDEEPVMEEWMKPVFDYLEKKEAEERAAQERVAQEGAAQERASQAMDAE